MTEENDYKTGVAWSDTFLPAPGATYRKILRPDPTGVWGKPGLEVQYLLQSEKPAWPDDVANEVVAPGDHPSVEGSTVRFIADHRRLFFTPLRVDIPPGATDAELATWLTPVSQ